MAERTIYEGRVVTMNGRSDVHDPGRVYVEGTTIAAVRPADETAVVAVAHPQAPVGEPLRGLPQR